MPHFLIRVRLAFKCHNYPNGYNNSKRSYHASWNEFSSPFPTAAWSYLCGFEIYWDEQAFRHLKVKEERDVITWIEETWETTRISFSKTNRIWIEQEIRILLFFFFFFFFFYIYFVYLIFILNTLDFNFLVIVCDAVKLHGKIKCYSCVQR